MPSLGCRTYIHGPYISLPNYGSNCWMTNCAEPSTTGRRNSVLQSKFLEITVSDTYQILKILDEYPTITSSLGTDTFTVSTGTSYPNYGAVPTTGTGATVGGYVYTSPTTVPWISGGGTGSPNLQVNQNGKIDVQGHDADIEINGKSMRAWMERVEERLNILTVNPDMEKDWDDLRRLGERYKKLEKKCREKARMWAELKKVQTKP